MKKLTPMLSATMLIIVLSTASTQSMQSHNKNKFTQWFKPKKNAASHTNAFDHDQGVSYSELALQAQKYNDTDCLLLKLPTDIIIEIFCHSTDEYESTALSEKSSYQSNAETKVHYLDLCMEAIRDHRRIELLKDGISTFVVLHSTCKKFNSLLTITAMGNLFKRYSQTDKNLLLKHLISPVSITHRIDNVDESTETVIAHILNRISSLSGKDATKQKMKKCEEKRKLVLITLCAGADPNTTDYDEYSLLEKALDNNDTELVDILFKLNANPLVKIKGLGNKLTREMKQVCINNRIEPCNLSYTIRYVEMYYC